MGAGIRPVTRPPAGGAGPRAAASGEVNTENAKEQLSSQQAPFGWQGQHGGSGSHPCSRSHPACQRMDTRDQERTLSACERSLGNEPLNSTSRDEQFLCMAVARALLSGRSPRPDFAARAARPPGPFPCSAGRARQRAAVHRAAPRHVRLPRQQLRPPSAANADGLLGAARAPGGPARRGARPPFPMRTARWLLASAALGRWGVVVPVPYAHQNRPRARCLRGKAARSNEVESLKNAKAVLSGADFS